MSDPLERYRATEYHRRNMQVARVCGAQAAVDQALERALSVKSIPVWMIAYLESAASRLPGLQHDLAAWRDLAPDAPAHIKPERADAVAEMIRQAVADAEVKALRRAADELKGQGYNTAVRQILALIDKPIMSGDDTGR